MPLFDVEANATNHGSKASVTRISKPASITPVALVAANNKRIGTTVVNRSTATLYLDVAQQVSPEDFLVEIPPGAYYEMPFSIVGGLWGIWTSTTGKALIRDFIEL
jgi:hypothetical protein